MFTNRIFAEQIEYHRLDAEFYDPEKLEKLSWIYKWKIRIESLSDCCELITDGTHITPNYKLEGIKFLSSKNISPFLIDFDDTKYISKEEYFRLGKANCNPKPGDILISKSGKTGTVALYRNNHEVCSLFEGVALVRYKGTDDLDFIVTFLNSSGGWYQFRRLAKTMVITHIHLEEIRKVKIPKPIQEAQTYIGDKVRIAERLRERSRELESVINDKFSFLSTNLKSKSKSWRVRGNNVEPYRLNTSHYDAVIVDMLDKAKNQSDLISLGSLFGKRGISGGATPKGAEYPEKGTFFVRVQNVKPLRLDLSDAAYLTPTQDEELKRSHCKAGDIILSITGYPGVAAVVLEDDLPININQHSVRFDVREGWEAEYIAAALNTNFLKMQVERLAIGGTRIALDYTSVSNLLIPVFPQITRKAIAHNVKISNGAIRESQRLTTAAKLLVEALIEGKLTEDELKSAQISLQKGDTETDKAILSRLTRKGIDIKDEPPLFPDIDALYEIIDQISKDGEAET
jgi:type I restriction enzyme, S subunit